MKKSLVITIIMSSILVVVVLSKMFVLNDSTKKTNNSNAVDKNIDSYELNQMLNDKDFLLMDVHIPEQRHIPGTDVVIPYNQMDKIIQNVGNDKERKVVVYCRSGSMSRAVVTQLRNLGYENIYELTGGLNSWTRSGFETIDTKYLN